MTPRPLVCALALSLVAALAAPSAQAQKKKRAAKPKAAAVSAVCTDFYSTANADWLKANTLTPGLGSVSALEQLNERARQQQFELLNSAMAAPQGNVQKLLGDFWASGLDEAAVERDGANPIAPLLTRINAIRRTKDVPAAIAALHQVGIPVAFNFSADVDLQDLDRHVGYFSQGGMGLPDPAFYTRMDADTREVLGYYNNYVQKILALTGTPQAELAAQAQQVIDLETRLARVARPLAELRDPRANYALVPVAGLAKQYRGLQLANFLKAQGVTDDSVSIANTALFTQLDAMVSGLKPEQWKTYLRWRVGDAMAPYLSRPWREAHYDFRGRRLAGLDVQAPRQQQVLDAINLAAGPMLAREYVGRYLPPATRTRAEEIATQVRDALASSIERDARLGPQAKAEARAKLAGLKVEIGAPRRDLDYTVQPMGRGSFGSNMLIASTWRHREEMRRIGRGNAERRWNVLPQQPALAYDVPHNRLIVTAAMLQPPVLDMSREPAAHYGAYGAMVGHELSHSFGPRGRLVDAKGELRDWWTPAEVAAWDQLSARIAAQYGAQAYPELTGIQLNGSMVRDVGTADLSGLEAAWTAFRSAQPDAAKEPKQAFFRAWAGLWPQQLSVDAAAQRAAGSVYPPGKARTNTPLMNVAGFGEAFDCKAGTPMQAKVEQQVVLWR
ncbi:MAG: Metallopeptidase [uncultured Lysobacter sp.]|uniref:Metallopeptidase n=1 Tax=uncultured Lysobacter sp. TaxID=271060 RepID=A0A6J4KPZ8_9GAMM|nr:MAG: Metallopeptidase [uncultured Lysobacter sp.]